MKVAQKQAFLGFVGHSPGEWWVTHRGSHQVSQWVRRLMGKFGEWLASYPATHRVSDG